LAEGQPESIVQDIENMVRSFIEKVWLTATAFILYVDISLLIMLNLTG